MRDAQHLVFFNIIICSLVFGHCFEYDNKNFENFFISHSAEFYYLVVDSQIERKYG